MVAQTLYDKIWQEHIVRAEDDGTTLLYIDRHLVHEVTSPQAYEGLREAGRRVWRPSSIIATADHNTPTTGWERGYEGILDPVSKKQITTLDENVAATGAAAYFPFLDPRQGIVHVVGPENGATLPGMTIVCGDSHTSTHGAFAALAYGIGTSEVEHVLGTQTLIARRAKNMLIRVDGQLAEGITAKDIILTIIGQIGVAGGAGHTIEYAGNVIRSLSMEARMTICNMSIEAGARAGLIAVDDTTIEYLRGRRFAPGTDRETGEFVGGREWDEAVAHWRTFRTDQDAQFDRTVILDASDIVPQVTWGTDPSMVTGVNGRVPDPEKEPENNRRRAMRRALEYMALEPGVRLTDVYVDKVFLGSCTNARIEDLRIAASLLRKVDRKIAPNIKQALVVPGSGQVKRQAESEGLDKVFLKAGFEWREPGCSMCLGMNPDHLLPGERCASTSNRNFEGRQGQGGRTHLVSPAMAVGAAMYGHFVDIRQFS